MGRRTNGPSDQWVVGPMSRRTNGSSDQWVVGLMGRRTNGPSDYRAVTVRFQYSVRRDIPCRHVAFTQCRFNVGPPLWTLAQHWNSIGLMPMFAGISYRPNYIVCHYYVGLTTVIHKSWPWRTYCVILCYAGKTYVRRPQDFLQIWLF